MVQERLVPVERCSATTSTCWLHQICMTYAARSCCGRLTCHSLRRHRRRHQLVWTSRFPCLERRQARNRKLADRRSLRSWLASRAAERRQGRRRPSAFSWIPHAADQVFARYPLREHGRCSGDEGGRKCDDGRCLHFSVLPFGKQKARASALKSGSSRARAQRCLSASFVVASTITTGRGSR